MNWLITVEILIAIGATIAVITVGIALFLRWRFRGVFHWNSSLKEEKDLLEKELAASENDSRTEALKLVLNRYEVIYKTNSPSISEVTQVVDFVKDIARCYHPGAEKPE